MKIRTVICVKNEKYINSFLRYYETHYNELSMFDIHVFSDFTLAQQHIAANLTDFLLLDEDFGIQLPVQGCSFCAYLVNDNAVDTVQDVKAIGKYQKVDNIFKTVLSCYAETIEDKEYNFSTNAAQVCLFQNAGGGTGCTCLSMAYAVFLADMGKKVLYLNLEKAGDIAQVFWTDQNTNFGDILYAVKSGSSNLAMRIMASVVKDYTGVNFIKKAGNILDMLEITRNDLEVLLTALTDSCDFEYIVIDKETGLNDCDNIVMKYAHKIVYVLEATPVCQSKFLQLMEGLKILDSNSRNDNLSKIRVIFNKYGENQRIDIGTEYQILGGLPYYENMEMREIVQTVSKMKVFSNI